MQMASLNSCLGQGLANFFALQNGLSLALFCRLAITEITNDWCMQSYATQFGLGSTWLSNKFLTDKHWAAKC